MSSTSKLDQLDLEIIAHLQRDGRKPLTEIANVLGVSEGTVRNRLQRLLSEQVVQVIGLVNPIKLGFDAPAMIGVSVNPTQLHEVAKAIGEFQEVSYMSMVSGEFDLLVEVMCRDRLHLASFISEQLHQIPGIVRTQTFIILRTFKMAYGAVPITQGK